MFAPSKPYTLTPQYTGAKGIIPDIVYITTNPDAVLEFKARGCVVHTVYDPMCNIVGGQQQPFDPSEARNTLKDFKTAAMFLRKASVYSRRLGCAFVALWDGDHMFLFEFWRGAEHGQVLVLLRSDPDFLPTYAAWLNRALRRNGNGFNTQEWALREAREGRAARGALLRQARAAARLPRNWGPKGPVRPKWLKKRARNGHRSS